MQNQRDQPGNSALPRSKCWFQMINFFRYSGIHIANYSKDKSKSVCSILFFDSALLCTEGESRQTLCGTLQTSIQLRRGPSKTAKKFETAFQCECRNSLLTTCFTLNDKINRFM